MGDGECDEGSVWEAAMSAAHYKMQRLIAIVDHNRLQSDGANSDIMNLGVFEDKWKSFGWDVYSVDGNDFDEIHSAFSSFDYDDGKPKVVIANTVKGKGISFMENSVDWHHRAITELEYQQAVEELS